MEVGLPCKRHIGVVEREAENAIEHDLQPVLTSAIPGLTIPGERTDADTLIRPQSASGHTRLSSGAELRRDPDGSPPRRAVEHHGFPGVITTGIP